MEGNLPKVKVLAVLAACLPEDLSRVYARRVLHGAGEPTEYHKFFEWLDENTNPKVIDEHTWERLQLINGRVNQGKRTITEYLTRFKRACDKVPDLAESEKILHFLRGLVEPFATDCAANPFGQRWKSFADLESFARSVGLKYATRREMSLALGRVPEGDRRSFHKQSGEHRQKFREREKNSLAAASVHFQKENDKVPNMNEGKRQRSGEAAPDGSKKSAKDYSEYFGSNAKKPCSKTNLGHLTWEQVGTLLKEGRCLYCLKKLALKEGQGASGEAKHEIRHCPQFKNPVHWPSGKEVFRG